jgi:glycosyltransferase involved in cell wall biosynthesis
MKLYIVSLKRFFIKNNKVHTYGGFGEYVKMFLDDFDEIHLCVPLSPYEIEGGYEMEHPKIHYHFLPNYKNELWLMIKSPVIFLYLLFYLPKSDVINPRIPDMTGVYGWLIGKLFRRPMFVSIQSDITLLLENENSTKLKGIMKKGLFAWMRFYMFFEKIIMKNSLAFPQGQRLVEKYSKTNPKAIPWISTALYDKDIVLNLSLSKLKDKEKIVLLNVGRLTRAKNQITLIESLNILHKIGYKNVYLRIVGKMDENIYNELKDAIKLYNLEEYVEFVPPVNHGKDLWKIFDDADIFVLSSIWEGTPKVLLEALGRSLPIVSTNVGGIPTVIKDKYNGLLCGKNDSKAFSKNIEKLINMDQESLNEFIKNGHSEVSKYTISAQKKVLIDSLYKYRILSK